MAQPGTAEYYFDIQVAQHTNDRGGLNQPIPNSNSHNPPPNNNAPAPKPYDNPFPSGSALEEGFDKAMQDLLKNKAEVETVPTIQTADLNKVPKDAIEPSYIIETALFSSFATLKTLYEAGKLIRDAAFTKSKEKLNNKFPNDPSKIGHIFREKEGHIQDTPENRSLIEKICNKRSHYLGDDKLGNTWFAYVDKGNKQVWARVRDNKITNAGINENVRKYNPETGLNAKEKPKPTPTKKIVAPKHHTNNHVFFQPKPKPVNKEDIIKAFHVFSNVFSRRTP
jgi:hypothetical protein